MFSALRLYRCILGLQNPRRRRMRFLLAFSLLMVLGSPITRRTSFGACSRYMVKSTGLSPSPWGVPTFLVKGAFIPALFILVLMCVLLNKNCMSLSSSSSTMFFRICRRISLSMVSNAADMSIPVIFIFMFSVTVFAASHMWVQTTSEVLRSGLKPL